MAFLSISTGLLVKLCAYRSFFNVVSNLCGDLKPGVGFMVKVAGITYLDPEFELVVPLKYYQVG